jgi:hypothetical protein
MGGVWGWAWRWWAILLSQEQDLRVGRRIVHRTCTIAFITLLHSSFPSSFLATPLATSVSIIQFIFALALEAGESRTFKLAIPSSLYFFLGAKSFSDNLTLGGGVGGSGSGAGEWGSPVNCRTLAFGGRRRRQNPDLWIEVLLLKWRRGFSTGAVVVCWILVYALYRSEPSVVFIRWRPLEMRLSRERVVDRLLFDR